MALQCIMCNEEIDSEEDPIVYDDYLFCSEDCKDQYLLDTDQF